MPSLYAFVASLIVTAALAGAAAWRLTSNYISARYESKIAVQKTEAAQAIAAAQTKLTDYVREQARVAGLADGRYQDAIKQINDQHDKNRAIVRQLGGLRDPGRRQSCNSPVPNTAAAASIPAAPTAESELSEQASEFLYTLTRDADEAAAYATECHAWAIKPIGTE